MSEKAVKLTERAARKLAESYHYTDKQRLSLAGGDSETQFDDRRYFWGVTVATTGTEYTDERYTVVRARPTNNGDAATVAPTFTAYDTTHPLYVQVTARNLTENGAHGVAVGTPVIVFWDYDSTTDPRAQPRYWFVGNDNPVRILKVTSTLAVGYYKAKRWLGGTSGSILGTSAPLDLTALSNFSATEDCVLINRAESGKSAHYIPTDGTGILEALALPQWVNDQSLPTYICNYPKVVRDIQYVEATGELQKTFEDKTSPTWIDITTAEDCP